MVFTSILQIICKVLSLIVHTQIDSAWPDTHTQWGTSKVKLTFIPCIPCNKEKRDNSTSFTQNRMLTLKRARDKTLALQRLGERLLSSKTI